MAAARCMLEAGEQLKVESGAMMATSGGVTIEASTQGGVMKGLKRSVLGGESLFISTYTAPAQGGWVDVAHHLTGDIVVAGVTAEQPMNVTKGCWLASSPGVELQTKWGGFKNMFGGEGGFLLHAEGRGTIVLACYGALDTIELSRRRDGHDRQRPRGRFARPCNRRCARRPPGSCRALKSGEGFVFDFTGPGWVMTQSRNPSALEAWMRQVMPGQTGGVSGGLLGKLGG